jgi:hypothetical protein
MRISVLAICAGCGRLGFGGGADAADSEQGVMPDAVRVIDAPPQAISGDAAPPNACGPTVVLQDDFNDTTAAPLFNASNGANVSITESGGLLTFTLGGNVRAGRYSAYRSNNAYSAADLCAVVVVVGVPNGEGAAYYKLSSGSEQIEFFEHAGALDFRVHDNTGAITNVASIPYDPARPYWRLRHQTGFTHWETSADGVAYTDHAGVPTFTVATFGLEIGGGSPVDTSAGGQAVFDSALLSTP